MTQRYFSGNTKRDKYFSLPAKVIAIRPHTHEMSVILQFPDGKTTIRDRIHCKLDPSQPQPDTINNIEASPTEYLKLIPKTQEETRDAGQLVDSMLQKLKARGNEVEFLSEFIGSSNYPEIISNTLEIQFFVTFCCHFYAF